MPRRRRYYGGNSYITDNLTGVRNINRVNRLMAAKHTPQAPGWLSEHGSSIDQPHTSGQIGGCSCGMGRRRRRYRRHRMQGGRMLGTSLRDKYGEYVYVPNLVNT